MPGFRASRRTVRPAMRVTRPARTMSRKRNVRMLYLGAAAGVGGAATSENGRLCFLYLRGRRPEGGQRHPLTRGESGDFRGWAFMSLTLGGESRSDGTDLVDPDRRSRREAAP